MEVLVHKMLESVQALAEKLGLHALATDIGNLLAKHSTDTTVVTADDDGSGGHDGPPPPVTTPPTPPANGGHDS